MNLSVKPILTKSAKVLAVLGFLVVYAVAILFIAKVYLVEPNTKNYPLYKYNSGKSDTDYDSSSIDAFINKIDTFIMENEILSRIDKFISENKPKKE